MKAMILAAGRGQRMMPLTQTTPKPLLKVKGIALIEHAINALKTAGIIDIIINTYYLAHQLKKYLDNGSKWGVTITYSDELSALETAGGIIKALPLLGNEPFIVINSDILCDYNLANLQLPKNTLAHLLLIDNPPHHKNGDFSLNNTQKITNICGPSYTFSGIGIYHPNLFKPYLSQQKLPLLSVFKDAIAQNKLSGEYFNGFWQDIGTPQNLASINR